MYRCTDGDGQLQKLAGARQATERCSERALCVSVNGQPKIELNSSRREWLCSSRNLNTHPTLLPLTPDFTKARQIQTHKHKQLYNTLFKKNKKPLFTRWLRESTMACGTVALLWLGTTQQGRDTQSADNLAKTTNLITYKKKKKHNFDGSVYVKGCLMLQHHSKWTSSLRVSKGMSRLHYKKSLNLAMRNRSLLQSRLKLPPVLAVLHFI